MICMSRTIDGETRKILLGFQKNEITEHFVYKRLAEKAEGKNKQVLEKISEDELSHYKVWKKYTQEEVAPDNLKILKHVLLLNLLGLTFTIKLMENGEGGAQQAYKKIMKALPETKAIIEDENEHEKKLIGMIEEEKLNYIGSMVLGLNDALVELTGTLAGLTFALQDARIVGMAGIITGIAASLSMASSEYLSKKAEGEQKPLKASFYTGLIYLATVFLMVYPFFVFSNHFVSLGATIINVVVVILFFTYFISVVKEVSFKKRFAEMIAISLGVAAISFGIGLALRLFLNIDA